MDHTRNVSQTAKGNIDQEISGAEASTKSNRKERKEDREEDQQQICASISGHWKLLDSLILISFSQTQISN